MSDKQPGQTGQPGQTEQSELAGRKKAAVRTALILAVVAIAVFFGFIWIVSQRGG